MDRAMAILAHLDPIIENKRGANAALLLKWINVRCIERRWIYKTLETKPETNTPLIPLA
jgi:hypothetical protein